MPLSRRHIFAKEEVPLPVFRRSSLMRLLLFKMRYLHQTSPSLSLPSLSVDPHLGLITRYLLLFDSYGLLYGAPSLTRGRVCLLYMLLALTRAVFFGSEFLGTRDHIILSQIWDFPFCRLLRLAGSRCRYSTPPPHVFRRYSSFSYSLI
jgi:hypothetical protein